MPLPPQPLLSPPPPLTCYRHDDRTVERGREREIERERERERERKNDDVEMDVFFDYDITYHFHIYRPPPSRPQPITPLSLIDHHQKKTGVLYKTDCPLKWQHQLHRLGV